MTMKFLMNELVDFKHRKVMKLLPAVRYMNGATIIKKALSPGMTMTIPAEVSRSPLQSFL